MQNWMVNLTILDWIFKSKRKSQNKTNKNDIWKWKFVLIAQNFTILQEKIHWIEIQMTPTNAELNGEFNDIGLKIEIEAKIPEEKKDKRHLEEKISLNYTKMRNFRKENSLNQNSNDTDKCRI